MAVVRARVMRKKQSLMADHDHNIATKTKAVHARAARVCMPRALKSRETAAALPFVEEEVEFEEEPVGVEGSPPDEEVANLVDDVPEGIGMRDGAEVVAGAPAVLEPAGVDAAPDDSGRYEGGGVPCDGSTSAPRPQGMASPSGCVAFGGGVLAPLELAMMKRPVQVRLAGSEGEENW